MRFAKRNYGGLWGVVFWGAGLIFPAWGAPPESFKLLFQVNRVYRDKDVHCFGSTGRGQLLVSGEIAEEKVISAKLENFDFVEPYKPIYRSMDLAEGEVGTIELYRDAKSRPWVTQIEFAEPTLRWIAYESAARYSFCPLPQMLKTLSPAPLRFHFESEGVEIGIWISESERVNIEGARHDGNPFSGSLQFTQRRWTSSLPIVRSQIVKSR